MPAQSSHGFLPQTLLAPEYLIGLMAYDPKHAKIPCEDFRSPPRLRYEPAVKSPPAQEGQGW